MSRRNYRRYALVGGSIAVTAALAYHVYQSDTYGRSKRYFCRLRSVLQKYIDAFSTGGDICTSLLQDLQQFLQSEGNDVPSSLSQLAKLLQSQEFTNTTSSTVEAILRGLSGPSTECPTDPRSQQSIVDKILDALLSDRGHSLVSVAVSMGAKNMVSAYIEASSIANGGSSGPKGPDITDKLVAFLSTPAGQQLAVTGIAAFASNGMRIYMDKSLDVNLYEDLFSSMSKPRHLEAVKQCVSIFARDVVAAYLQGGTTIQQQQPMVIEVQEGAEEVDASGCGAEGGAVSIAPSPTCSAASGSGEIGGVLARVNDDVDSDSLLHAKKAAGKRPPRQSSLQPRQARNHPEWISVVGQEFVNASKEPAGRQAIVEIVGTATREAIGAVSSTVVDKFSTALFVAVMLGGVLMAILFQMVLRFFFHIDFT